MTVEDEAAYLTAQINGSAIALSSQDIFWVEEASDGANAAKVVRSRRSGSSMCDRHHDPNIY